jgi:hypothetical protein
VLKISAAGIRLYALAILLSVLGSGVVLACPNCKDTLANDPAQAGLVRGFFWSIMFMVSMPFLVFGGISAYFYWEVRRAKAAMQLSAGNDANAPIVSSPFADSGSAIKAGLQTDSDSRREVEEPVGAL